MFETYRMLGQEHEADLAREAERARLAEPLRQRRRHAVRAVVPAVAIAVAFVLVWLFA